jgi:RNA polymerase sigma-70 factor, ECF subfamily
MGSAPTENAEDRSDMQASALVDLDLSRPRGGMTEPADNLRDLRGQTDEDLLRLCARGRQAALEEIVRRYQAPLYRFLLRMLNSPEDAEEATMDVFVRAWQHAPRFEFRAKVATWLYRIAVNIARDMHSRKKSRPQEPWPENHVLDKMAIGSAEDDALGRLARQDQNRQLTKAMSRLSESDRMLLALYYLEEREYEEIQKISGLSYTVLKTRLARARRRLRGFMDEENSESSR